jgi:uncharacterized damage-inducible protein DinB
MKADQIRELFDYHFAMNEKIWDQVISKLSDEQFLKEPDYPARSVRSQLVHMIDIDRGYLEMIKGERWRGTSNPANFPDKESIRAYREETDALLKDRLGQLEDGTLLERSSRMQGAFEIWHMYLHMITHSIDHRAQLMSTLNQVGVKTVEQDLALHLLGGKWPSRG